MSSMMGPPRGAYLGPYPTQKECMDLLAASGEVQRQNNLSRETISVGRSNFKLNLCGTDYCGFQVKVFDKSAPTAAVFQQQCIVVRFPLSIDPLIARVYLFDAKTGEPFAVYFDPEQ